MSTPPPVVGSWYQLHEGDLFEVVAWDPDDRVIEVQFYDGTIDEYELESWSQLGVQNAQPPEDWAGSLDVPSEDYGVDLDRPAGEFHHNPLDDIN